MVTVTLTTPFGSHRLSEREPYGFIYGKRIDLKRDEAGWLLRGADLFEIRLAPGVPRSFQYGVEVTALLTL